MFSIIEVLHTKELAARLLVVAMSDTQMHVYASQLYSVGKLLGLAPCRGFQEMGADVTVNCVHPGIVRTRLNRDREGLVTDLAFVLLSKLLKTIPQVINLLLSSVLSYADCNRCTLFCALPRHAGGSAFRS